MDILRTTSVIAWRLFRLPMRRGEHGWWGCCGSILHQMRKSRGAPTIPSMGRVLATEIRDVGRTPDSTTCGEGVDEVQKSMIEGAGFAIPAFALKETVS